ncbi:PQQ-dependent sugar dehydrogenase [Paenibacillus dakarensis]|uniref:PQQ-dependent sugar dehydrogenase n=1 Tax=Paenibacillus dakarensis TaxID=1527293 RepID=UPI0006D56020|nr:PQQ-dependent sugar dehydrogenase [Paenibacillus dakarensis]
MLKIKAAVAALLIAVSISGCSDSQQQQQDTAASPELPAAVETESELFTVIAERLDTPWSIDFDEDKIYISERKGNIVTVEDGRLSRLPVRTSKEVKAVGEGGFLGLVLAEDFPNTGQAYAYHTYDQDGETMNRVIVIKKEEDQWVEVKSLLEEIPGSNVHNGGRLAIGPDQHLYITTGDAGDGEMSQDERSLGGKILRMTLKGEVPEDNPFPDSFIYSLGHRNSQGLAWNDEGEMYNSEHGPSGTPGGHDEINLISAGNNYGWPDIFGDEMKENMKTPEYHTGDEAIAPSGIAFEGSDHVLVAGLRGESLYRYNIRNKRIEVILEGEGRLRDVKINKGKVYLITNNTDGRGRPSDEDDRLVLLKD